MDRVGFEPTTSAAAAAFLGCSTFYPKGQQLLKENLPFKSHPLRLKLEIEIKK
jgi:hypothetical protein